VLDFGPFRLRSAPVGVTFGCDVAVWIALDDGVGAEQVCRLYFGSVLPSVFQLLSSLWLLSNRKWLDHLKLEMHLSNPSRSVHFLCKPKLPRKLSLRVLSNVCERRTSLFLRSDHLTSNFASSESAKVESAPIRRWH
jgi:hypothetical protein